MHHEKKVRLNPEDDEEEEGRRENLSLVEGLLPGAPGGQWGV